MNDQIIQEIEISKEQAEKTAALGVAADRLFRNPNFKKVILEGYFQDEIHRLTMLMTDPAYLEKNTEASIVDSLRAVSELNTYLHKTVVLGRHMAERLAEYDRELDALREEG